MKARREIKRVTLSNDERERSGISDAEVLLSELAERLRRATKEVAAAVRAMLAVSGAGSRLSLALSLASVEALSYARPCPVEHCAVARSIMRAEVPSVNSEHRIGARACRRREKRVPNGTRDGHRRVATRFRAGCGRWARLGSNQRPLACEATPALTAAAPTQA